MPIGAGPSNWGGPQVYAYLPPGIPVGAPLNVPPLNHPLALRCFHRPLSTVSLIVLLPGMGYCDKAGCLAHHASRDLMAARQASIRFVYFSIRVIPGEW